MIANSESRKKVVAEHVVVVVAMKCILPEYADSPGCKVMAQEKGKG